MNHARKPKKGNRYTEYVWMVTGALAGITYGVLPGPNYDPIIAPSNLLVIIGLMIGYLIPVTIGFIVYDAKRKVRRLPR